IGECPSPKHSIGRINDALVYSKETTEWTIDSDQARDRRPYSNTGIKGISYSNNKNQYNIDIMLLNRSKVSKARKTLAEAIQCLNELVTQYTHGLPPNHGYGKQNADA